MDAFETRLAKIENRLRFQRRIIAFLLIAVVALVGFGSVGSVPKLIRANQFEVVDKDGNVVSRLGHFHRGSGALEILTREGKVVVIASALRGNGYLKIYQDRGELLFSTEDVGSAK